ncbi:MAG TPA: dihydrolipoamide acetyltransferase family protein [bacterium]|nr:dihydrolipoamide acetyltransferase family protein [bacterium]
MATEVVLPRLGLTQEEGTVVRWLKPEGSQVRKGEPLFEVMTDKATLEVEAPASGMLLRVFVAEGGTVPVATPIAVIGEPGEAVAAPPSPVAAPGGVRIPTGAAGSLGTTRAAEAGAPPLHPEGGGRAKISPRARALAEAHGVDARALVGTGPGGRIIERDVQTAVAARSAAPTAEAIRPTPPLQPSTLGDAAAPSAPAAAKMRAIIARRMLESLQTTAQLTLTTEVDMDEAVRLRSEVGQELERREGVRVTYTDLIVRAAAVALREHPRINALWEGEGVRVLPEIHIGVAVALGEGLVVPVVRHADRATLGQISAAVRDLSERAKASRLRPEEMQGGTFTVTNLGMFDVDAFTPVLNPPEAGILGVGRLHRRPVAVGDRIEVRSLMVLSLTFDHRVIDGAPAAQFLQRVKFILEHPYVLLLP